MCSKCENCEFLLQKEDELIQWCKELSERNIGLHKKLLEKQEVIEILKNKLVEKRAFVISEYVGDVMYDLKQITENKNLQHDDYLQKCLKEKLEEMNQFITIFQNERESFQKELDNNEKYYSENITYLNGLIDYFRESMFNELENSNRMKQYFLQKFEKVKSKSYNIVLTTLEEETERLHQELKHRYQKTIEKINKEKDQQNTLISKLRQHNRKLYLQTQQIKRECNVKNEQFIQTINDLHLTIKKLKEKNRNLHTQIKLEVEGCCHDIQDTRKRIRHIIKSDK